jgi:aryl-alcohol dehydrogenase-like predicted oxidoreductase
MRVRTEPLQAYFCDLDIPVRRQHIMIRTANMQKIQLGKSPLEVSSLCLGTDLLGSKRDEVSSFELLDYFQERGGSFIDTGNFYASWLPGKVGGESETVIGKWMKARGTRPQSIVATKLGFPYPGSPGGLTAGEIARECEMSLRRLQTDRIDLYYVHKDDRETPLAETMEALQRLIAAGKVRAIGASNLAVWRIAESNLLSEMQGWTAYCAIEQKYTYLRPRYGVSFGPQTFIGQEVKDYVQSRGMSLIGYSVLLGGACLRPPETLPIHFAGPDSDARLAALQSVAAETGATVNQVILAWLRQSSPPVLPIIAGSSVKQLAENIDALNLSLADAQMELLDNAGNPAEKTGWVNST